MDRYHWVTDDGVGVYVHGEPKHKPKKERRPWVRIALVVFGILLLGHSVYAEIKMSADAARIEEHKQNIEAMRRMLDER